MSRLKSISCLVIAAAYILAGIHHAAATARLGATTQYQPSQMANPAPVMHGHARSLQQDSTGSTASSVLAPASSRRRRRVAPVDTSAAVAELTMPNANQPTAAAERQRASQQPAATQRQAAEVQQPAVGRRQPAANRQPVTAVPQQRGQPAGRQQPAMQQPTAAARQPTVQQPVNRQQQVARQPVYTQQPVMQQPPVMVQKPGRMQQPVYAGQPIYQQQPIYAQQPQYGYPQQPMAGASVPYDPSSPQIVYVPVPVPAPAAAAPAARPERTLDRQDKKMAELDFGLIPRLNLSSGLEDLQSGLGDLVKEFQSNGGFWNGKSLGENVVNTIQLGVKAGLNTIAPLVNGIASSVPIMVPSLNGKCLNGKPVRPNKDNRRMVMCLVGTGAQVTDYITNAADLLAGMAGKVLDNPAAAQQQQAAAASGAVTVAPVTAEEAAAGTINGQATAPGPATVAPASIDDTAAAAA